MGYTPLNPVIPFVISVEVPCGFVLQNNAATLPKTLFIDTHCSHILKTTLPLSSSFLPSLTCNTPQVNAYIVAGTLHYNMRFGGFLREDNANTASTNSITNISKIQSICLNKAIAYNCDLTDTSTCTNCNSYKILVNYNLFKLYSDINLNGIDVYSNISTNTLTPEAANTLQYPTGCKTIIVTGTFTLQGLS